MNKLLLSGLILILPGLTHGQGFILPSLAIDSAYFEIVRGRACEKLQEAQAVEISALLNENLSQAKIILLQKQEISLQAEQISLQLKQLALERELMKVKNEGLKRRLFKVKRVAWLEGAGIIVLGALIIL